MEFIREQQLSGFVPGFVPNTRMSLLHILINLIYVILLHLHMCKNKNSMNGGQKTFSPLASTFAKRNLINGLKHLNPVKLV